MEGEMAHDKAPIVKRLRTIEGHVRGVERVVEEDAYCIDILMQIDAIQKALDHVSRLVLDGHLHGCVTTAIRSDDAAERERVIGELMHVMHERRK
jgi:DNA-binding FrmR family transcriptional regulator